MKKLNNMNLSPAEIIFLIKKGRIREHLKDIVKLTFYFLVLKGIITIELKVIKKTVFYRKDSDFFISLNMDTVEGHTIATHEKRITYFAKSLNQEWISLEQFWDAAAALVSDKFRLFSKEHRIENFIKHDLLEKGLLRKKQIKMFNIVLFNKIVVSSNVKNLFDTVLKIKKSDNYSSIMHLTGIEYGDFFDTKIYDEINDSIDTYIERFLLQKGGWVVAGMALLRNNYPEPITSS